MAMIAIEKTLNSLGLGHKEQIIYKLILEHGKIAPPLLSRLAKINRTTVYSVAKELKDKGLIVEDLGGKIVYYSPAQGGELEKIVKREIENLKVKESAIAELTEFIKNAPQSKNYSVPKIRFIEEADLENYLYEATPRWTENQMAGDDNYKTWWGYQDHTFVEKFNKWIVWFWKQAPKEIDLKLFSNDSLIENKMKSEQIERRQIKFWKGENDFTGTQWIVGDYIILIVTKEHPYYLVEIKDAVMAHNMREVFKKVWE